MEPLAIWKRRLDGELCKALVTAGLRPGYDLPATEKMLESWANRRKNVRLVAEVVGDRQGKISRSKVVRRVKNQSHRKNVKTYLFKIAFPP